MSDGPGALDGVRRRWDAATTRIFGNDLLLVAAVMLGIYVLFTAMTLVGPSGGDLGAIVSNLQAVTFWTALYAMMALALNLHWGYTGLFNIGVAGFMAVGVYAFAALTVPPSASPPGLGLPLVVGIAGGMLAAAFVGVLTALPALRLRADYLAIVTVALSEIIRRSLLSPELEEFTLFSNLGFVPDVTLGSGAGRGINMPTNPSIPVKSVLYTDPGNPAAGGRTVVGELLLGLAESAGVRETVVSQFAYTLVLVAVVVLFYWLLVRVGNSPFGRVLKAIREDELVANSLGKDTRVFKIKVFALGCALMGLGGILWEAQRGFTDASVTTFRPLQTFYIFVALIIGGAGSNTGSVLGGALFAGLLFQGPLFVRRIVAHLLNLGDPPSTFVGAAAGLFSLELGGFLAYTVNNISELRFVFLGLVLIYLMQRRPTGLLGHRKEAAASVDLMERPGGESGE